MADAGVDELELAVRADEDHAALVEPELLRIPDVPRDQRAGSGRPDDGNAVDAAALTDDGDALTGHESPIRDGKARLERVRAEQRRDVLRREANEPRRMGLSNHGITISKGSASVKRRAP